MLINNTVTQTLQLQHNSNQAIYADLVQNRDVQGIKQLGFEDGLNGRFPLDPMFSFYYSHWCEGFQQLASSLTDQ